MGEAYSVSKLLVVLPHSNIERTVGAIQERIFKGFGLTSAVALPPVIPLRFVSSSGPIHAPTGMTVRSTRLETEGRSLYLGVELHVGERILETDDILETAGKKQDEPSTAPPFPEHHGFYLCTSGDASLLSTVVEDLSPPPHLDFHPLGIALLTMRYLSGVPWWSHLTWEMDPPHRIRKHHPEGGSSRSRRF